MADTDRTPGVAGAPGPAFAPHVLRDYALLADGERGALVGPHGDIAWMCAPRWDSDAVFSGLIGGGGTYAVTPRDPRHVWGGSYERGSLIWRSRWLTCDGPLECREALAFPGAPDRVVLLRRVLAVGGPARVRVLLAPRAGFGSHRDEDVRLRDGVWSGRSGPLHWRWSGAGQARVRPAGPERSLLAAPDQDQGQDQSQDQGRVPGADGGGPLLAVDLTVPAGGHHDLVLELSEQPLTGPPVDPERAWHATEEGWARARPALPRVLAARDARHAHSVLRGLTSGSGGMVAAATMSLPERADSGRSYDYRYAWIRDQSYAGIAAAAVGATDLLDRATAFVTHRLLADGPRLAPAYTVTGGAVPAEHRLGLPGYPGGTDKVGNWVNGQFQLDAFGEALSLLAAAARHDRLDRDGRRALGVAVDAVEQRWSSPDAGIWELEDRHWTHSRLACVAGLRAVAALPGDGAGAGLGPDGARCSALADAILSDTTATHLHADGFWQRSPKDGTVDAALLLPAVRGALPAADPRTRATLAEVRRRLVDDGYVYRFRHDSRPLGEAEGAFLLCGFVMALAEHQQGRTVSARHFFERNRAACGSPGLFAEEYDVAQRQLRGNLPQAFVHALLLECAGRLAGDAPAAR
ncbi:glycoside hydrolase family 15 protein [Streptomyces sp. CA2R106]|uniref:glycoside hydrolase family 15 protein n=1 Tax=Streptomyces sp. CA2R106 TaxID=3120153 RepID=UPI00300BE323